MDKSNRDLAREALERAAERCGYDGEECAISEEELEELEAALDAKDEQLTPDPLGLAARVVVLADALRECLAEIGYAYDATGDQRFGELYRKHGELLVTTPSPAVEAVREVLVWTLQEERALDAAAEPGYEGGAKAWEDEAQRCREAKILAVDHLRTHFPALAAGLKNAQ